MNTLELELVLPCYNEEKSLPQILARAVNVAQKNGFTPETFNLVLVENGSGDHSLQVMETLKEGALGAWMRIVRVPVNQGYGFGLWSGLCTTTAPLVAWSHADQQCDPADVMIAFKKAQELLSDHPEAPILIKGERFGRNWKDQFVSRTFEAFAWCLLGLRVREMNAQPKLFSRKLLSLMTAPPKNFAFDLYALYWARKASFDVRTIPVLFPPRVHGMSNWAGTFLSRYKTIFGMIRYMWHLARAEGKVS